MNSLAGAAAQVSPVKETNRHATRVQPGHCTSKKIVSYTATIAIVAVIVAAILYIMFSGFFNDVGTRLSRGGWIVYYLRGCVYCIKQKELLGGRSPPAGGYSFVECDMNGNQVGGQAPPIPCGHPVIKGYPFWFNVRTKETRAGLQSLSALKSMA